MDTRQQHSPKEDRGYRQHGHNSQDLGSAAKLVGNEQHLCQGRVQWELGLMIEWDKRIQLCESRCLCPHRTTSLLVVTIFLPSGVSPPVLSSAPSTHSWYSEVWITSCSSITADSTVSQREYSLPPLSQAKHSLTCGGGSIKANSSRLSTPRLLSSRQTLERLVRWISGIWLASSSR